VSVASAGPYASLHLAPDRQPCQHPTTQFFTGRMPFLPTNQQRRSTEGISPSCMKNAVIMAERFNIHKNVPNCNCTNMTSAASIHSGLMVLFDLSEFTVKQVLNG